MKEVGTFKGLWYLKKKNKTYAYTLETWNYNILRSDEPDLDLERLLSSRYPTGKIIFSSDDHFPIVVLGSFRGWKFDIPGDWHRILYLTFPNEQYYTFWSDGIIWSAVWTRAK